MKRFVLLAFCILVLELEDAAFLKTSAVLADDTPASSTETTRPPKKQKKTKRLQKTEKSAGKQAATNASPRYQMLAAGKRVVILDTQTGTTRIIEPETPTQQSVKIGKSWITVTVQLNGIGNTLRGVLPSPAAK